MWVIGALYFGLILGFIISSLLNSYDRTLIWPPSNHQAIDEKALKAALASFEPAWRKLSPAMLAP